MEEQLELRRLKEEINLKKVKLNNLAKKNLKENNIVKLSKELDILINKYYLLKYKWELKDKKS